jgi:uncharacterized iron-regulated membrane protein
MKLATGLKLKFWHRWLGIIAIIPLILSAITGIGLTYKNKLIELFVSQQGELPKDYQVGMIVKQFDQVASIAQEYAIKRIKAPNIDQPYWTITEINDHHTLLNIETLAPFNNNLWLMDILHFFHKLHVEFLTGDIGKWLLFFSSIIAIVLTLSGIYLWWPGRKGFRWRFVKVTPWTGHKSATLLQFHRHSGIVFTPTLFIIVFTGAVMMWQKQISPILSPLQVLPNIEVSDNTNPNTPSKALALALIQVPDGWPTFLRMPDLDKVNEHSFYRFRFQLNNEWHPNGRTSVNVYPQQNKMIMSQRSDTLPWQYRLINQSYPLHSGYGMHWLYVLLVLFSGWYLLWLNISGGLNYLYRSK